MLPKGSTREKEKERERRVRGTGGEEVTRSSCVFAESTQLSEVGTENTDGGMGH